MTLPTLVVPEHPRQLYAMGRGRLELVERTAPGEPGAGEILVRVERTLISGGTELAKIDGLTGARAGEDWRADPLPLGYSAAGAVVAVGEGAPLTVGDRVSLSGPHADVARVRAHQAAVLPAGVSLDAGTFGTLAALAVHIVRASGLALGDTCCVVGFGVVGQLVALIARTSGARVVAVRDHHESHLALAESLGLERANDCGYDIVFESAGSVSSMQDALAACAPAGRVVVAGSLRSEVTLDVYRDIHAKSVAVIGVHGSSQHRPSRLNRWSEAENRATALQFMSDGRLPVERLITERIPAQDSEGAFARIRRRTTNAVILDWTV